MATAYGFGQQDARTLLRVARREGLKRRDHSTLIYPESAVADIVTDLVQVWSATGSPQVGDILEPNADNVFPARIKHWNETNEEFDEADDVWVRFADFDSIDAGDVLATHGKHYFARLAGRLTSEDSDRPLFVSLTCDQTFIGKPDADIAKGASGTISLWHRSTEADSTINKTAKALGAALTSAKWVTVERISGQWYAGLWECP
jgi:hypothetical protein